MMSDISTKPQGDTEKEQLTRQKPELPPRTSPITLAYWLVWETYAEREGTATEMSTTTMKQRTPASWSAERPLRRPPLRRRKFRPGLSSATAVSPTTAECGASGTGTSLRES